MDRLALRLEHCSKWIWLVHTQCRLYFEYHNHYRRAGKQLRFFRKVDIVAPGNVLPLANDSIDFFHYFYDPLGAMCEWMRVTKMFHTRSTLLTETDIELTFGTAYQPN